MISVGTRQSPAGMAVLAWLMMTIALVCADDTPENLRRYHEGQLVASDFQAAPPTPLPRKDGQALVARTSTDVKFNLRYRGRVRRGRYEVTVDSIEFFAVFEQDKSWLTQKSNRALLDHEQGHFDIAQICALEAQVAMNRLLAEGDPPRAEGDTKDEAVQRLDTEVQRWCRPYLTKLNAADADYDRVTRHGALKPEQARARAQQKEQLVELGKRLEKVD